MYTSSVYDDLVETKQKKKETADSSLYVNPHPNCSLINPDAGMIARFQKLGIRNEEEHFYDQVPFEEAIYDEVAGEEEEEELIDVINTSGDKSFDLTSSISSSSDIDDDDDVDYHKLSHATTGAYLRMSTSSAEPLYDIPPDAV